MEKTIKIRWNWLRLMYGVTIVFPGLWGLGVIFIPDIINILFQFPDQYHFLYGVTGSMWLSFSVLSAFGISNPLKFLPVLMFQFTYKVIWIMLVVFPLWINHGLTWYELAFVGSMFVYVIGDIIAIPFGLLISGEFSEELTIEPA